MFQFLDLNLTVGQCNIAPLVRGTKSARGSSPATTGAYTPLDEGQWAAAYDFAAYVQRELGERRSGRLTYGDQMFRVMRFPGTEPGSVRLAIRSLRTTPTSIESLELPGSLCRSLAELHQRRGLFVVAGDPGAGKSVLAGAVAAANAVAGNTICYVLSSPAEHAVGTPEPNRLIEIEAESEDEFPEWVEDLMRGGATMLLVSEIRSPSAAAAAITAAANGFTVITTTPASSIPSALIKILRLASAHRDGAIATMTLAQHFAGGVTTTLTQLQDGRVRVRPAEILWAEPLADSGCSVRATIRDGHFHMLPAMIAEQAAQHGLR